MLDSTWSKVFEHFRDKVSSEFEEPTVCELEFELTEVPHLRGTSAFEGETLMAFWVRKVRKTLDFPNT